MFEDMSQERIGVLMRRVSLVEWKYEVWLILISLTVTKQVQIYQLIQKKFVLPLHLTKWISSNSEA